MIAINTGRPTPTLTPMMILLLTPPVFPLITPLRPEGSEEAVDVGGTYDTGLPLVEVITCLFVPKAIVLVTLAWVVAGKVASDPESTEVTRVLVTEFFMVVCSDTGQFTSPVDRHIVAVYVISVLIVVVVKPPLAFKVATLSATVAAAVAVPVTAHTSARVV